MDMMRQRRKARWRDKRIDELGISPWPWSAEVSDDDRFVIYDSEGYEIAQAFSGGYDSTIMSAAPKMYDALQRIIQAYDDSVHNLQLWQMNFWEALNAARAALAKAAGEEVANG